MDFIKNKMMKNEIIQRLLILIFLLCPICGLIFASVLYYLLHGYSWLELFLTSYILILISGLMNIGE